MNIINNFQFLVKARWTTEKSVTGSRPQHKRHNVSICMSVKSNSFVAVYKALQEVFKTWTKYAQQWCASNVGDFLNEDVWFGCHCKAQYFCSNAPNMKNLGFFLSKNLAHSRSIFRPTILSGFLEKGIESFDQHDAVSSQLISSFIQHCMCLSTLFGYIEGNKSTLAERG